MAAIPASPIPSRAENALPLARQPVATPRASLARLALLHDEARETALLANLLGRAPYAAVALAGAGLLSAGVNLSQGSLAATLAWLVLVAAAVIAIAHAYSSAIAAPFARDSLLSFSKDLSAILFYAGFAWGAGAFLVLPAAAPALEPLLFSAGICALVALLLRARDQALLFLAPVAGLSALASLMRGEVAGLYILLACGAVAGAIYAADRLFAPQSTPGIAVIPAR